jgi:hypothetical protein
MARHSPKPSVRGLWWIATAAVVGLMAISGANPPSAAPPATAPPAAPPPAPQINTPPPADSPFDEPLHLIGQARKAYQDVSDYRCTFIKRERIDGKLQPENVMVMSVRVKPFSVYLDWKAPRDSDVQQACYVAGRNDGMMLVHPTGALGLAGFLKMNLDDSRVTGNSRHAITEAGFGHLIERFSHCYEAARKSGKAEVKVAQYDYNKRRCTRIELTYTDLKNLEDGVWRSVLYLDKESHLPVRCECYAPPRDKGGEGELLETYSYVNVQLNVGLADEVFKH